LLLETFLNNKALLVSSEKEVLERKLTKEGLDTLCQKQNKLVELRTKLDDLLRQEKQYSQIQIPPK